MVRAYFTRGGAAWMASMPTRVFPVVLALALASALASAGPARRVRGELSLLPRPDVRPRAARRGGSIRPRHDAQLAPLGGLRRPEGRPRPHRDGRHRGRRPLDRALGRGPRRPDRRGDARGEEAAGLVVRGVPRPSGRGGRGGRAPRCGRRARAGCCRTPRTTRWLASRSTTCSRRASAPIRPPWRVFRADGASSEETVLAAVVQRHLGVPALPLLRHVRAGGTTWGRLLHESGVAPKDLDGIVRGLVK